MKRAILSFLLGAIVLSSVPIYAGTDDFNRQMKSLSREYFALRPMLATYYGVPDSDAGDGVMSRLGHFGPADERVRREGVRAVLAKLDAMDEARLSPRQRVSLRLIQTEMEAAYKPSTIVDYGTVLGEYGLWFLPYPVSHLSGPHVEFPAYMADKFAVATSEQARGYLARLKDYPSVIDGLIETIKHDKELGVVPPDFVIDKTIGNLQLQLEPKAGDHPLVASFKDKLTQAAVAESGALVHEASSLVETGYFPATKRLIVALESIRPLAAHEAGVSRLPKGEELYQAMITHLSDSSMTAQEIHALGLSEVARITADMDPLLRQAGHQGGTVGERMTRLLNDPQYIYPNTAEGKAKLFADIRADLELVNAKLEDWFGLLPDQPVAVKAVPDSQAASTSGAFYDAPSQDGSRPGTYWISLHDTSALPSYSLQTLTYHEANPGHHLQTLIGLSDELPILNTIFYSNAAGEGWALYAERLAAEMGIYDNDPVDNIGRLQSELHRAVRLVVDTGMHALGWSREQAIDYSVATEGIHPSEATGEIERYAVWPGQALGYKLGELKILELRERAKKVLGDQFDIKTFHDRILEDGALPLGLMEEKIDHWLDEMSQPN